MSRACGCSLPEHSERRYHAWGVPGSRARLMAHVRIRRGVTSAVKAKGMPWSVSRVLAERALRYLAGRGLRNVSSAERGQGEHATEVHSRVNVAT